MIKNIRKSEHAVLWFSDKKIIVRIHNGGCKHPALKAISLELSHDPTEDQVRKLKKTFNKFRLKLYRNWYRIYDYRPIEGQDVHGAYAYIQKDAAESLAEEFLRIGENN